MDKHSRMGWWWWHIDIIEALWFTDRACVALTLFRLQPGADTQWPQPLWTLNTAKRHTGFGWVQDVRDHSSHVHPGIVSLSLLLPAGCINKKASIWHAGLAGLTCHSSTWLQFKGEACIIMWFISSPLSCAPNKFHTLFEKRISEAVEPPTNLWSRALRHHYPAQLFQSAIASTQRRSEGLK